VGPRTPPFCAPATCLVAVHCPSMDEIGIPPTRCRRRRSPAWRASGADYPACAVGPSDRCRIEHPRISSHRPSCNRACPRRVVRGRGSSVGHVAGLTSIGGGRQRTPGRKPKECLPPPYPPPPPPEREKKRNPTPPPPPRKRRCPPPPPQPPSLTLRAVVGTPSTFAAIRNTPFGPQSQRHSVRVSNGLSQNLRSTDRRPRPRSSNQSFPIGVH